MCVLKCHLQVHRTHSFSLAIHSIVFACAGMLSQAFFVFQKDPLLSPIWWFFCAPVVRSQKTYLCESASNSAPQSDTLNNKTSKACAQKYFSINSRGSKTGNCRLVWQRQTAPQEKHHKAHNLLQNCHCSRNHLQPA